MASLSLCLRFRVKLPLLTKNYQGVSLWELGLSVTQFDPLITARGALGEPTSSNARTSGRWLIVHRSVSHSLLIVQGRILVSSLILRDAVPSNG
jgi:hypothetical protein